MKESSECLILPSFDTSPFLAYPGPLPAYLRDRARAAALTEALLRSIGKAGFSSALLLPDEELPCTLVGTRGAARKASGPVGLSVARPHAPCSPLAASPYDGEAFEVAAILAESGRANVTHLVSGLRGFEGTVRHWGGGIYELCRFAAELRRSIGLVPPGLVLRGGVRFPRRGGAEALCRAWSRVARSVAETTSLFGLVFDSILMDLGAAFDQLTLVLLIEARAAVKGRSGAIACDAPAPLLRRVLPGADLLSGGGCRYRLVSILEPADARLPKIDLSDGAMPRRLALRCRSREPGWPVVA